MQIVLLFSFSILCSFSAVCGTQFLLEEKRKPRQNLLLFLVGVLNCFLFSVLVDCIIKAGRPTFYYLTHKPGPASLKVFGIACLSGSLFFALFIMLLERKHQAQTILCWLVRSFLIGACGAIVLEIGCFNFRHFELIGSKAPRMTYSGDKVYCAGMYFNRAAWKFIPYDWHLDPEFFVYTNYAKVRNVRFEFDGGNALRHVELGFDDRAHRRLESIGEHEFIPEISRSFTVPLHTVGGTNTISMKVLDDREVWSEGVALSRVSINQTVPLELDPVRFTLCFLAIFLFSVFFPGSSLWRLPLNLHAVPQAAAVFGLMAGIALFCVWTVFSSYTGSKESMTGQKAALNENCQQYDKLVDALAAHQYALLETPHHYLEKDGDPYDMKLREERQYDYPWDTAYYQGKYYVYFGVVPAVTVLLPYKLLTGSYLPLDYPILGFSLLFLAGIYGVYSQIVKRCFPKICFALYWNGLLLLCTALNLTWCLRRTLVYELAITSGICFAVWGICFMLFAFGGSRGKTFFFLLSGACTALSVGCRPTMLFVSFPVFVLGFFALRSDDRKGRARNLLVFFIPYFLAAGALLKYNYERFNDPLEFGITWQLTTENRAAGMPLLGPSGRMLSILASLFTFPKVDLEFPFIHPQIPDLPYNGVILNTDGLVGFFSYPLMVFIFLLPLVRKTLVEKADFLFPFCAACLAAALGICVTASAFAITNRYLTDWLFLAGLPAVITLFSLWLRFESAGWTVVGACVVLTCACVGTALFISLSLTGEGEWFRRINPLGFEKLRYAFSPWL